jgi:tetratricopeptide (TPR) repeat protein
MSDGWDARVETVFANLDEDDPQRAIEEMTRLAAERPGDPAGTFELAGVYDSLGMEAQAAPLYREAIAAGLQGERRHCAAVQLASTLRNLGHAEEAVSLLEEAPPDESVGAARDAFLALALFDAGRSGDALRVALRALAPTLPRYARAVDAYAAALPDTP